MSELDEVKSMKGRIPNFLERDNRLQIVIELDKKVLIMYPENHTIGYDTIPHIFVVGEYG